MRMPMSIPLLSSERVAQLDTDLARSHDELVTAERRLIGGYDAAFVEDVRAEQVEPQLAALERQPQIRGVEGVLRDDVGMERILVRRRRELQANVADVHVV